MAYNTGMKNRNKGLMALLFSSLLGTFLYGQNSLAKAENKTIRFVALGDFGTGSSTQYAVAKAMENHCKKMGCDFALSLGDNIYNNGVQSVNDPLFQSHFEKPFARLNFPFYMVLGNHDYRGNVQAQIDYSKKSKKWVFPRRYYHFQKGPVTFLALDTNTPADGGQKAFVSEVKQQLDTPWLITFGHHPRKTYSAYKNALNPDLKNLLDGLCGVSQFYLAGHEHDQQHLKPHCGTDYVISGTGAGYRPNGRGPDTLYSNNKLGFSWFEVSEKHLYFAFISSTGEKLYDATRKLP